MQKFTFADEATTWSFGYEIEGQAKVTKLYEFSDTLKWIGIHGLESPAGIEKIGIITMDPTCTPLNGVLQPKPDGTETGTGGEEGSTTTTIIDEDGNVVEVVTPDKPQTESTTVPDDSGSSGGAIVATIVVCVIVALLIAGVLLFFFFFRKSKHNKAMNRLQAKAASSRPNYDKNEKVIKQDPVKVGDVYEANLYSDEENGTSAQNER